jgi:hypothetical protein
MHGSKLRLALAAVAGLAACAEAAPDRIADSQAPASSSPRASGLTYPVPENHVDLVAALRRHYPRELAERGTRSVFVDVTVSETGAVTHVDVLPAPPPDPNVRMVILEKVPDSDRTVEREHEPVYDDAFAPAARAALKEVRFRPAMRQGKAIPYTVRIGLEFTRPSSAGAGGR